MTTSDVPASHALNSSPLEKTALPQVESDHAPANAALNSSPQSSSRSASDLTGDTSPPGETSPHSGGHRQSFSSMSELPSVSKLPSRMPSSADPPSSSSSSSSSSSLPLPTSLPVPATNAPSVPNGPRNLAKLEIQTEPSQEPDSFWDADPLHVVAEINTHTHIQEPDKFWDADPLHVIAEIASPIKPDLPKLDQAEQAESNPRDPTQRPKPKHPSELGISSIEGEASAAVRIRSPRKLIEMFAEEKRRKEETQLDALRPIESINTPNTSSRSPGGRILNFFKGPLRRMDEGVSTPGHHGTNCGTSRTPRQIGVMGMIPVDAPNQAKSKHRHDGGRHTRCKSWTETVGIAVASLITPGPRNSSPHMTPHLEARQLKPEGEYRSTTPKAPPSPTISDILRHLQDRKEKEFLKELEERRNKQEEMQRKEEERLSKERQEMEEERERLERAKERKDKEKEEEEEEDSEGGDHFPELEIEKGIKGFAISVDTAATTSSAMGNSSQRNSAQRPSTPSMNSRHVTKVKIRTEVEGLSQRDNKWFREWRIRASQEFTPDDREGKLHSLKGLQRDRFLRSFFHRVRSTNRKLWGAVIKNYFLFSVTGHHWLREAMLVTDWPDYLFSPIVAFCEGVEYTSDELSDLMTPLMAVVHELVKHHFSAWESNHVISGSIKSCIANLYRYCPDYLEAESLSRSLLRVAITGMSNSADRYKDNYAHAAWDNLQEFSILLYEFILYAPTPRTNTKKKMRRHLQKESSLAKIHQDERKSRFNEYKATTQILKHEEKELKIHYNAEGCEDAPLVEVLLELLYDKLKAHKILLQPFRDRTQIQNTKRIAKFWLLEMEFWKNMHLFFTQLPLMGGVSETATKIVHELVEAMAKRNKLPNNSHTREIKEELTATFLALVHAVSVSFPRTRSRNNTHEPSIKTMDKKHVLAIPSTPKNGARGMSPARRDLSMRRTGVITARVTKHEEKEPSKRRSTMKGILKRTSLLVGGGVSVRRRSGLRDRTSSELAARARAKSQGHELDISGYSSMKSMTHDHDLATVSESTRGLHDQGSHSDLHGASELDLSITGHKRLDLDLTGHNHTLAGGGGEDRSPSLSPLSKNASSTGTDPGASSSGPGSPAHRLMPPVSPSHKTAKKHSARYSALCENCEFPVSVVDDDTDPHCHMCKHPLQPYPQADHDHLGNIDEELDGDQSSSALSSSPVINSKNILNNEEIVQHLSNSVSRPKTPTQDTRGRASSAGSANGKAHHKKDDLLALSNGSTPARTSRMLSSIIPSFRASPQAQAGGKG